MGRGWMHGSKVIEAAKKGKAFTKIAKEIAVAVKLGGDSPDANPRLRMALRDAQKNSVPKDTVARAIKRGVGGTDDQDLEEVVYEGFGPERIPLLVETLTDNRNRTVQDLRSLLNKNGGQMADQGSVLWMFDKMGAITASHDDKKLDPEEAAIEAGADDVEELEKGVYMFWSEMTQTDQVAKALEAAGWQLDKVELLFRPKTPVDVADEHQEALQEFIAKIDGHDDVKTIHLAV